MVHRDEHRRAAGNHDSDHSRAADPARRIQEHRRPLTALGDGDRAAQGRSHDRPGSYAAPVVLARPAGRHRFVADARSATAEIRFDGPGCVAGSYGRGSRVARAIHAPALSAAGHCGVDPSCSMRQSRELDVGAGGCARTGNEHARRPRSEPLAIGGPSVDGEFGAFSRRRAVGGRIRLLGKPLAGKPDDGGCAHKGHARPAPRLTRSRGHDGGGNPDRRAVWTGSGMAQCPRGSGRGSAAQHAEFGERREPAEPGLDGRASFAFAGPAARRGSFGEEFPKATFA